MSRLLVILAALAVFSCKPKLQVVEKHHILQRDSVIVRNETVIRPAARYVTTIERPCKEDSLRSFEDTFEADGIKVLLKEKEGSIVAEIESDSIVSTNKEVEKAERIVDTKVVTETIVKRYIPKWVWYNLGLSFALVIWTFRKPLIRLVKPI